MRYVGLALGIITYSALIYFAALAARRPLPMPVIPPLLERTIAIIAGLWWVLIGLSNVVGGMSETAESLSVWGGILLVAILVTLVWVGRTRWQALRIFAWALLAFMSIGVVP